MTMIRLIPHRRMIVVVLILTVLFGTGLNFANNQIDQFNNTDNTEQETQNTSNINMNPSTNDSIQEIAFQDTNQENLQMNDGFTLLELLITLLFMVVLYGLFFMGYRSVINTDEVITMINNSLELAGFSSGFSRFGKSYSINEHVKLQLHQNGECTISMPLKADPRLYGFREENGKAIVHCNLQNLQLTLQSVNRYLLS